MYGGVARLFLKGKNCPALAALTTLKPSIVFHKDSSAIAVSTKEERSF
jgi:hypothetical protein